MSPTSSTPRLSFDEHVDQVLALFTDSRPRPTTAPTAHRRRLVLVPAVPSPDARSQARR